VAGPYWYRGAKIAMVVPRPFTVPDFMIFLTVMAALMMNFREIQVGAVDVRVDSNRIFSLLGPGGPLDYEQFSDLVESCIRECMQVLEPRAGFVSLSAGGGTSGGRGRIVTAEHEFRTGNIIERKLRGAEQYHFFLATTGPGPARLVREHMARGNYPEGYIADRVGSVMAEAVADIIHHHLMDLAAQEGQSCTNRYSPGYCGWDVAEQAKLFRLFPERPLGITLTTSCVMDPAKSVSALVATGKAVQYFDHACELCSMKECIFRNSGNNRTKA